MNKGIYIAAFSSQVRHYDEFEQSYLPLFHTIYGVYENIDDALRDAYALIYSESEKYELIEEHRFTNEHGGVFGSEFVFKYTDSKHGGYAICKLPLS